MTIQVTSSTVYRVDDMEKFDINIDAEGELVVEHIVDNTIRSIITLPKDAVDNLAALILTDRKERASI